MITSIQDLIVAVGNIVGLLIPLTAACALLFFFWGLVGFIQHAGDEKAVTEGRRKMLWGIIVLFIITSVWGIVGFIEGDLFGGSTPRTIPVNSRPLTP